MEALDLLFAFFRRRGWLIGAVCLLMAGLLAGLNHRSAGPVERPGIAPQPPAASPVAAKPLGHGGVWTGGVPILMYHAIGTPSGRYPGLYVKPADFRAQITLLKQMGFQTVTLRQVYDAWEKGAPLPPKPIVITFDDGYRGVYTDAFPAMRAQGYTGTLFIEANILNTPQGLTDAMVGTMLQSGFELGSHTLTHRDLTRLPAGQVREEVAGSRAELASRFHHVVDFFCYPAGRYNPAVVEAVRAAGYLGATTTRPGLGAPGELFALRRVRVQGGERAAQLARSIMWLIAPGAGAKHAAAPTDRTHS